MKKTTPTTPTTPTTAATTTTESTVIPTPATFTVEAIFKGSKGLSLAFTEKGMKGFIAMKDVIRANMPVSAFEAKRAASGLIYQSATAVINLTADGRWSEYKLGEDQCFFPDIETIEWKVEEFPDPFIWDIKDDPIDDPDDIPF